MSKIIKISDNIVYIGMENGTIKEVMQDSLNFPPAIGDIVDVYESENNIIVSLKEPTIYDNNNQNAGININVNNSQNIGQQSYQQISNTKVVNKVIYCLLAFFLGGLGAHKFYAGKIGSGVLYLLFCWTYIPLIIAFIEFIIALCKKADTSGNIWV